MPMAASIHASPRGNPQQILATIWQRNLPLVHRRVQALRTAARLAMAGPLEPATRIEASEIAHKLTGSLGMFGYPNGSEIARNLELLLDSEAPLSASVLGDLITQLERALAL